KTGKRLLRHLHDLRRQAWNHSSLRRRCCGAGRRRRRLEVLETERLDVRRLQRVERSGGRARAGEGGKTYESDGCASKLRHERNRYHFCFPRGTVSFAPRGMKRVVVSGGTGF